MTLRLRPVMSASFCSVCASGLLSCANCACITCGAQKGPETSAQSEARGPRPRPRQFQPWRGLSRVPPQHTHKGRSHKSRTTTPTPRPRPHTSGLALGTCSCSAVKDVRARLAGLG